MIASPVRTAPSESRRPCRCSGRRIGAGRRGGRDQARGKAIRGPTRRVPAFPESVGDVEVDASIMDGLTLQAGAVAPCECEHAISLARKVMEELPHVLLVGTGAERFAKGDGVPGKRLLTAEAKEIWREIHSTPEGHQGTRSGLAYVESIRRMRKLAEDPERPNETGQLHRAGRQGQLATGVSTRRMVLEIPGDSATRPCRRRELTPTTVWCGGLHRSRRMACASARRTASSCTSRWGWPWRPPAARPPRSSAISWIRILSGEPDRMDARANMPAFPKDPDATYVYMTHEMRAYAEVPRIHVAAVTWGDGW